MSYGWPILSTITFLPLLGALLICLLRGADDAAFRNARFVALWTTLITFAVSLILLRDFAPLTAEEVARYHEPIATPSEMRKEREVLLKKLGERSSVSPVSH